MNKSYVRICGDESEQPGAFNAVTDWIQNNRIKNAEGYFSTIYTQKYYYIDYDFKTNSYTLPDELFTFIIMSSNYGRFG